MKNSIRTIVATSLLMGFAFGAEAQSSFTSEAQLRAMTCSQSTSPVMAKSTICVLEDQKLQKAYEALAKPSYEDVAAYLENGALINVLGAGYVYSEANGLTEASCRRTIAAHRRFTQLPEPEKLTGNLPEIAAGVAMESPGCLSQYPNLDPPVKAGEDSLYLQLGRMTIDCENAYIDLDPNAEAICAAGYDSLKGAQTAIGSVSLEARDTASFWLAYQAQMLMDLKLETTEEAEVCREVEADWQTILAMDPNRVADAVTAAELVSEFEATIAYCRETYPQGATTPARSSPTPDMDLSDLHTVSANAANACTLAAQGLPKSVTVEVCRGWLEKLETSKSRKVSSTDAELKAYWLALSTIHAILADSFEFIDQEPSARTCFQTEKTAMNVSTLKAAGATSEYDKASAARATVDRLLPTCRQAFQKPGWGAGSY